MMSVYKNRKIWRYIFYGIVISLSVSPALATDDIDNRNYLLIGCMYLGPIFFIYFHEIRKRTDALIITLITLIFATQILFNFRTMRWSSIFFSCMFFIYFLVGIKIAIKAQINYSQICLITKSLIYAYAIVLIIQQFCVLVGLPVFNGVIVYQNPWKLNSLSAEPSHTSRFLGVLMYSFLTFKDKQRGKIIGFRKSFKENKKVWLSFLWVTLTTISGTAFIVLGLILARYLEGKKIIVGIVLLAAVFGIGVNSEITGLKRSTTFLASVTTGDTQAMIKADHSASIRVVPWILCIERINPFTLKGWVGEGGGSSSKWMSDKMYGVPNGWTGGAIANYILEYGLLVGLIFLFFSFNCCYDKHNKLSTIGLWLICVIFIGVNTQIGWLCILMLFLDKNLKVNHANKSFLQSA